jgi:iron(III) transport system permease protein
MAGKTTGSRVSPYPSAAALESARTSRPSRRVLRMAGASGALTLTLSLALLLLIVYPLISTLIRTFVVNGSIDLSPFSAIFHDADFRIACRNTAILFVSAGPLALIVGSLFAWINERTNARMGRVARLLPLVTFFVPTIGMSIGWLFLGQQQVGFVNSALRAILDRFGIHLTTGPLNIASWPGLIFMYTVELVPFVYLIISAALRNLDPALEEASRMCGAGTALTVRRVSLPAIRPALASAGLILLTVTISLLSIPLTIGETARIDVISVYLVNSIDASPPRTAAVVAVSVLLVAVVSVVVAVNSRIGRGSRHATIGGKTGGGSLVDLGRWRWTARAVMVLYLLVAAVLPMLSLLVVAVEPFWTAAIDPAKFTWANFNNFVFSADSNSRVAVTNSLKLALIGATVCIAYALITVLYSHNRRSAVSGSIRLGTKIPSAISHLVIAISLLIAFGGAPLHLTGTFMILLVAYLVIYIPQASIATESARRQVGDELLEASRMSGARPGRTTGRILVPLMVPGVASGWAMVFVLIMGDITAAAILSGPSNLVVGAIILNIWDSGIFAQLAVLGAVICVLSALVVGVVLLSTGRLGVSVRRSGR